MAVVFPVATQGAVAKESHGLCSDWLGPDHLRDCSDWQIALWVTAVCWKVALQCTLYWPVNAELFWDMAILDSGRLVSFDWLVTCSFPTSLSFSATQLPLHFISFPSLTYLTLKEDIQYTRELGHPIFFNIISRALSLSARTTCDKQLYLKHPHSVAVEVYHTVPSIHSTPNPAWVMLHCCMLPKTVCQQPHLRSSHHQ